MRRAYLLLFGVSLVWGTGWIPDQMIAGRGTPCALAALRCALAAGVLGLAFCLKSAWRGRGWQRGVGSAGHRTDGAATQASGAQVVRTGLTLGLGFIALPLLLLIWAAQHGAGAWTPLIYAGLPLGLELAAGELSAAMILALGAMFVLLNGSLPLSPDKLVWTAPTLGAVVLQGWSLLFARRSGPVAGGLLCVATQCATASVLLGCAARLWEPVPRLAPVGDWGLSAQGALAVLALFGTAIAYPLYYKLLAKLEPAQLAVSEWLQTLIAAGEGAWLLRERPSWTMLGAAAALVVCTWLALAPSSEQEVSLR